MQDNSKKTDQLTDDTFTQEGHDNYHTWNLYKCHTKSLQNQLQIVILFTISIMYPLWASFSTLTLESQ